MEKTPDRSVIGPLNARELVNQKHRKPKRSPPPNMSKPNLPQPVKFGTFLGVFTPSVLTILGVMMYLRFGWVLGNLGLPLTILAVVLASSITFITKDNTM